jgi:hypothetical protein
MTDFQPYAIDMPAASLAGDLWRIEFQAPIFGRLRLVWVNNVREGIAQLAFNMWATNPETTATLFCTDCPAGAGNRCPHGPTRPDGYPRGWANDQVESMRIMPMCEAV